MEEFRYTVDRGPDLLDDTDVGLPGPFGIIGCLLAAASWGGLIAWWLA